MIFWKIEPDTQVKTVASWKIARNIGFFKVLDSCQMMHVRYDKYG